MGVDAAALRVAGELLRPAPRTLLGQLLDADDRSLEEACRAFIDLAGEMGEDTTLSTRTLQYWASGQVRSAQPARRRVAAALWGFSFKELVGPPRLVVPAGDDEGRQLVWLAGEASGAVVASVRAVLEACRRLDHSVGPRGTLATVGEQIRLVGRLVEISDGDDKVRFLSMLAELYQLAGWMLFDLRDMDAAREALDRARRAAEAAGDGALVAYVIGPSLGFAEVDSGRPREGLDLTYVAQGWARRSGNERLVAFTLAMGARAHAKLGEERFCRELMGEAAAALERHTDWELDPVWLQVFDRVALLGHEGSCLLDLGHAEEAAERLAEEDRLSPALYVRNRSIWLLDQASAFREQDDIDDACVQATRALELIGSTTSARTRARLVRFRESLDEWDDATEVRTLVDRLEDGPLAGLFDDDE